MKTQEIIDQLNWRYATKSFDATKKLNTEQLDALKTAVQLAPSSYGLQPYKVIVVSDLETKTKLRAAGYNQAQLTEASEIFVFATYKNFTVEHVDEYANNIAKIREIEKAAIQGFTDVMNGTVNSRSQEELFVWNSRQAYIALGVLLETAALLGIDACPMEGFDANQFNDILGLNDKNLSAVVIAPVGYRADGDKYQEAKKVRAAKEDLFIHI